jgi:purine-binding chemotaxis protein CheW
VGHPPGFSKRTQGLKLKGNQRMSECTSGESRAGKYLTLSLAAEEYGIPILKVKEIIGMMPITSVPRVADFVKGVINLRGKVIPVMDLRLKFGLEEIDYTERTCIIVVEIARASGTLPTGVIVDSVSEVIAIRDEDIEDTPEFGTTLDADFISGMAKKDGDIKILLDIDSVVSPVEMDTLSSAA